MPIYEYRCDDCGRKSSILFRTISEAESETPQCEHCGSTSLDRIISSPAPIRSRGETEPGRLRKADPRKAVENLSRQYDNAGIDPGDEFAEVARRAAKGDHPETLKKAVDEKKAALEEEEESPSSSDSSSVTESE